MTTNVVSRYPTPSTPTRLPDLIDRLFRESFVMPALPTGYIRERFTPGVNSNLLETDDSFIVQFLLPGADPTKFELRITGREMNLKTLIDPPTFENAAYIWRGFEGGEFNETFTLPAEVVGEHANAEFMHGILTVKVPKAESVKAKPVKVLVK